MGYRELLCQTVLLLTGYGCSDEPEPKKMSEIAANGLSAHFLAERQEAMFITECSVITILLNIHPMSNQTGNIDPG